MNVTDCDNKTDDYNSLTLNINCTIYENIFDIIIQTILFTIPCGPSFFCLMSLMVYTLPKPLFNNKKRKRFSTQLIQFDVS